MKKQPTLILIADGSHARLISHSPRRNVVLWRMASRAARVKSAALGTDRPGRAFDSAGHGRHAMEQQTSPQHAAQESFARRVAAKVEDSVSTKDDLVIVAAPRTIGRLRRALPETLHIAGELRKDLFALDDRDVLDHLAAADIRVPEKCERFSEKNTPNKQQPQYTAGFNSADTEPKVYAPARRCNRRYFRC